MSQTTLGENHRRQLRRCRGLQIVVAATVVAGFNVAGAAEPAPAPAADTASNSQTQALEEVTVTAQHLKLDWAQRNELVQKAITFVYGVAAVGPADKLPRWRAPVCPYLKGLVPEEGQYILERIWATARTAGGAWLAGKSRCQPNLRIYVTPQPKEFLRSSDLLGGATQSQIDQFIDQPGPVWVWHNSHSAGNSTGNVIGTFGPVVVVVDRARLSGVSQKQFADYIAMVSLAEIKPTAHFGDAQTILRLFEGAPPIGSREPERLGPGIPENAVHAPTVACVGASQHCKALNSSHEGAMQILVRLTMIGTIGWGTLDTRRPYSLRRSTSSGRCQPCVASGRCAFGNDSRLLSLVNRPDSVIA